MDKSVQVEQNNLLEAVSAAAWTHAEQCCLKQNPNTECCCEDKAVTRQMRAARSHAHTNAQHTSALMRAPHLAFILVMATRISSMLDALPCLEETEGDVDVCDSIMHKDVMICPATIAPCRKHDEINAVWDA